MNEVIHITTSIAGLKGVATCFAAERSFHKEARTQALALSDLCKALARVKELQGAAWRSENGLSGIIGDQITKKRKAQNIAEMDTFELVGGMMHGDDA